MLNKIKRRIGIEGEDKDELIFDLIEQSENYVKLFLGVRELNDTRLDSVILGMTVDAWNKLGEEGKASTTYQEQKTEYVKQLLSPYITILDAIKREHRNIIRFF